MALYGIEKGRNRWEAEMLEALWGVQRALNGWTQTECAKDTIDYLVTKLKALETKRYRPGDTSPEAPASANERISNF